MRFFSSPANWTAPLTRLGWLSSMAIALIFAGCSKATKPEPARSDGPANVRSSADVVKATAASVSIAAGGNADANVTLAISPGYHVNANPATFDYLIATQVTAANIDGLTIGKPIYPAGVKQKFQFADQPLAVYEGEAQIKLPLTSAASAAKGTRSLPLNIRVQACDQEKCFPPDTLHSTVGVEIR